MNETMILPVDEKRLREFTGILQKYKAGKASIERRTVASENWWKLRNSAEERKNTQGQDGFQAASGWLHNVIVSKHADAMDAYPEPNILPREPDDRPEARILTKVLPVILEQNGFEKTYSDAMWQKLKTGTGVYKVFWDPEKAEGLGDIAIERVDLLNVFWEPGVGDIQEKYLSLKIRDKQIDKTTMNNALRTLKRYNIVNLLDRDMGQEDARVLIYDSILMAVRTDDIEQVSAMVDQYRKGAKNADEAFTEDPAD